MDTIEKLKQDYSLTEKDCVEINNYIKRCYPYSFPKDSFLENVNSKRTSDQQEYYDNIDYIENLCKTKGKEFEEKINKL